MTKAGTALLGGLAGAALLASGMVRHALARYDRELPLLAFRSAPAEQMLTAAPAQAGGARRAVEVTSWHARGAVRGVAAGGDSVWVATGGGLWRIPRSQAASARGEHDGQWLDLGNSGVTAVAADSAGSWAASGSSVMRVEEEAGSFSPKVERRLDLGAPLVALAVDGDSVLAATRGGVRRVWRQGDGLASAPVNLGGVQGVTCLAAGKGMVVAGTFDAGAVMLRNGRLRRLPLAEPVLAVAVVQETVWASSLAGVQGFGFDGSALRPRGEFAPGLGGDGKAVIAVADGEVVAETPKGWTVLAPAPGEATLLGAVDLGGGLVLAATDAGLWRIRQGAAEVVAMGGMPDSDISALAVGPDSTLWIGTFDQGLFHFDGVGFSAVGAGEIDRHVNSVLVTAGQIWVGTIDGLYHGVAGGHWSRWTTREGLPSDHVVSLAAASGPLPRGTGLASLAEETGGRIWIGTSRGIALAGPKGVTRSWTQAQGLPVEPVYSLAADARQLWVAGMGGVARLDLSRDDSRFQLFTFEQGQLPDPWASAVSVAGGATWLGTYDRGMARSTGGTWADFREDPDGTAGPRCGWVFPGSALALPDGSAWFGTMGGGLVGVDDQGWRSVAVAGDDVPALAFDPARGDLWAGTRTGLTRVHLGQAGGGT